MESRQTRIAKRVPCAVNVGEHRYTGLVLNVSQGGLFVQTNADAGRGANVALELNSPETDQAIPVQARVVWRRAVPAMLRAAAHGGMGLRIERADEGYYQLLARWMRVEARARIPERMPVPPAPGRQDPPPVRRREHVHVPEDDVVPHLVTYRVRVRSCLGPRTRSLTIEAASADQACERALGYAGTDWKVIDVQAL